MAGAIAFTEFFANIDTVTLASSLFITEIVSCGNVIPVAGVFCVAGINAHRVDGRENDCIGLISMCELNP